MKLQKEYIKKIVTENASTLFQWSLNSKHRQTNLSKMQYLLFIIKQVL